MNCVNSVVAPIVTIVTTDKTNQTEVNVKFNTIFQLNCSVGSYPPAMVHWEVDGGQVSNNTVVLVDTSPHGEIITYTCVAVNVINGVNHSANNSINVIIQGKIICVVYYNYINSYSVNRHLLWNEFMCYV